MAILHSTTKENSVALSVAFNVHGFEKYNGIAEGWIEYDVALYKDAEVLLSCGGTIRNDEISRLCENLEKVSKGTTIEFEPLEPNFSLRAVYNRNDGGVHLSWFLDADNAAGSTFYSGNKIGIQMRCNAESVISFIQEIRINTK